MKVRTRFAPSPTGFLHIGGLRTALYNYIFAKQNNGSFILRIEDTDQNRLVENATFNLIKALDSFDLLFDEGPDKNETYGPYYQSQRLDIYKTYYLKLINDKNAYVCIEKNNDLLPENNVEKAIKIINDNKINFVIKLKVNSNKILKAYDQIRGTVKFDLSLIDDPIIIKSDGFPTYHFANVVDDHLMQISHVIRGEEWLPSLPKHILLYNYFNWDIPKFIHLPLLLNPDKSKLSKRQGDVNVEDFLAKGYIKECIINFISLLGWNPKNENEIFSINQLLKIFSIKNIQKSGAVFDIQKLNWMNAQYIKNLNDDLFLKISKKYLPDWYFSINDSAKRSLILMFIKNRITKLDEIQENIDPFNNEYEIIDKNILKSISLTESKSLYKFWLEHLEHIENIDEKFINNLIKKTSEQLDMKIKEIYPKIRAILYGSFHGPDIYTIVTILGIDETLRRLKIKY